MKKYVDRVLEKYPAKVHRTRKEHIVVKESDTDVPVIAANTRTIPGIITNRG